MSEAQEPGPLPEFSESQIVPDTDNQTETQGSQESCCGTSQECKSGRNENEEEDNASESDWKPEGSGEAPIIHIFLDLEFIRSGESSDKHARARRGPIPACCHGWP